MFANQNQNIGLQTENICVILSVLVEYIHIDIDEGHSKTAYMLACMCKSKFR